MTVDERMAPAHFETLQRVLRGAEALPRLDVSILLGFMLSSGEGADLEISRERFIIRYGWYPAAHKYFLDCAPSAMSKLMRWCQLSAISAPCAARFEGRSEPTVVPLKFEAHDAWFYPGEEVRVMLRAASGAPPSIARPPAAIRYEKKAVSLAAAIPCPHCLRESQTFRVVSDVFICGACGRSFPASVPVD